MKQIKCALIEKIRYKIANTVYLFKRTEKRSKKVKVNSHYCDDRPWGDGDS